ncbi:DUF2382 domain-containing protein [Oculatella sp. LEGE 06141]|uniref:DUF2382 domain-containing protein n=1 Tax=Oculatella sp. LEGE 06141 TaxID=1828648 RepID=UPI00187E6BE0|nr:DUF2382 domain-containing protein [Oculatella sp. LEGE 06141]MBE9177211.1 DUF2382 domain-containing protein [Oculatella sp. LEGE 06141]
MNSSVTTKQPGAVIPNAQYAKVLLDRLKRRLQGFLVQDSQGQVVGTVQDLILDPSDADGYFTLVVSQVDSTTPDHAFTLSSRSLHRIDIPNRVLFAKVNGVRSSYHELQLNESGDLINTPATAESVSAQIEPPSDFPNQAMAIAPLQPSAITTAPATEPEPIEGDLLGDTSSLPKTVREQVIRLLEEKLDITHKKRKAGEVVIRKTVETRIVEVPVRWEKLVIEQVGDEHKQLAEVDLGQGAVLGVELVQPRDAAHHPSVTGEFVSLEAARSILEAIAGTIRHRCKLIKVDVFLRYWDTQKTHMEFTSPRVGSHVLEAIAKSMDHRCTQVNIEVLLDSWDVQQTYQEWFNKYRKP